MEPRHMGVKAVLVKSLARIHETNLKKQCILALTYSNKSDYDKIREDDSFSILQLNDFSSGCNLKIQINHIDGSEDIFLSNIILNQRINTLKL